MIKLTTNTTVGKTSDRDKTQHGKISLASELLDKHIGKKLKIITFICEDNEEIVNEQMNYELKMAVLQWKNKSV